MPKWEYLEIIINSINGWWISENGEKPKRKIATTTLQSWYNDTYSCPNYYGKKGWELVKLNKENHRAWFLFKREL